MAVLKLRLQMQILTCICNLNLESEGDHISLNEHNPVPSIYFPILLSMKVFVQINTGKNITNLVRRKQAASIKERMSASTVHQVRQTISTY